MNQSKKFSAFLIALLYVFVLGCAGTAKQESTGEYVDDTIITARVKKAIADDPALKVTEINVETFKGRVQLSGFVSTPAQQERAVELARNVKGVKAVANDMRLK